MLTHKLGLDIRYIMSHWSYLTEINLFALLTHAFIARYHQLNMIYLISNPNSYDNHSLQLKCILSYIPTNSEQIYVSIYMCAHKIILSLKHLTKKKRIMFQQFRICRATRLILFYLGNHPWNPQFLGLKWISFLIHIKNAHVNCYIKYCKVRKFHHLLIFAKFANKANSWKLMVAKILILLITQTGTVFD